MRGLNHWIIWHDNSITIQSFESGFIFAGSRSLFEHRTLAAIQFLYAIRARGYFPFLRGVDDGGLFGQCNVLEHTSSGCWVWVAGLFALGCGFAAAGFMRGNYICASKTPNIIPVGF